MNPATRAHVALGANIDEPQTRVREALRALDALPASRVVARSSLYLTPPWGIADQPDFVNAVASLDTTLPPRKLLAWLQELEARAGRRRDGPRNGPRRLDLDLLLYGDTRWHDERLEIPHPRMHERAFVLLPLAEIAADAIVPGKGRVADLLAHVDTAGCRRLDEPAS